MFFDPYVNYSKTKNKMEMITFSGNSTEGNGRVT